MKINFVMCFADGLDSNKSSTDEFIIFC